MAKISSKRKAEYAIQTVGNALRMLEVFHTENEMGVSDLARHLGLHKNNAFRLLATLELAGYIQQTPETELYHLGPRCLELGEAFSRSHPLMQQARPILEALTAKTSETTHLGMLVGDEVVHLDGVLPSQLVLTGSRIGQRLPSHCTALGKALLAPRLEGAAEFLRSGADGKNSSADGASAPYPAHTRATIVDPIKLIDDLRSVPLRGYAVDYEEFAEGLCCVAAPVCDASSRVIAAISISGPSFRLSENLLHGDAAEAVAQAATQLSQELGAAV